ncbi:MAG: DUF805 domain-containing protein [Clostridiales bacterium]|jgi:uncharacterized membrane protein YhaH (DUF805 family)|nr:DUF805 domain-containing protein [Clostridiales bacterium]
MELVNNYVKVLKNYADFSGRARRREYWLFFLVNATINFVLMALMINLFLTALFRPPVSAVLIVIHFVYNLTMLLPALAAAVRRLHDIGKSWHWIFVAFVPFIGLIWFIVLMATEGETGDNRFGPNPKSVL